MRAATVRVDTRDRDGIPPKLAGARLCRNHADRMFGVNHEASRMAETQRRAKRGAGRERPDFENSGRSAERSEERALSEGLTIEASRKAGMQGAEEARSESYR